MFDRLELQIEVPELTSKVAMERWPTGCYRYRLEAGGLVVTRKVVVMR